MGAAGMELGQRRSDECLKSDRALPQPVPGLAWRLSTVASPSPRLSPVRGAVCYLGGWLWCLVSEHRTGRGPRSQLTLGRSLPHLDPGICIYITEREMPKEFFWF